MTFFPQRRLTFCQLLICSRLLIQEFNGPSEELLCLQKNMLRRATALMWVSVAWDHSTICLGPQNREADRLLRQSLHCGKQPIPCAPLGRQISPHRFSRFSRSGTSGTLPRLLSRTSESCSVPLGCGCHRRTSVALPVWLATLGSDPVFLCHLLKSKLYLLNQIAGHIIFCGAEQQSH